MIKRKKIYTIKPYTIDSFFSSKVNKKLKISSPLIVFYAQVLLFSTGLFGFTFQLTDYKLLFSDKSYSIFLILLIISIILFIYAAISFICETSKIKLVKPSFAFLLIVLHLLIGLALGSINFAYETTQSEESYVRSLDFIYIIINVLLVALLIYVSTKIYLHLFYLVPFKDIRTLNSSIEPKLSKRKANARS